MIAVFVEVVVAGGEAFFSRPVRIVLIPVVDLWYIAIKPAVCESEVLGSLCSYANNIRPSLLKAEVWPNMHFDCAVVPPARACRKLRPL